MAIEELLKPQISMFGEQLSVQRTPIIELNSTYGTSALRDIESTENGGTITLDAGEIRLRTGTTANGTAALRSARRGRYVPGYGGEVGVGIRIPTDATGNQSIMWGIISPDGQEGLYFGQDADGLYVARTTQGVETKIRQAAWNVDKLDGASRSRVTLDPTIGYIYQIRFSWYGNGQIEWGVAATVGRQQTFIPCHEERFAGLSLQTPNLPITAKADNGGDTDSIDAFIAGRQYSIIGDYVPKFRFVGQERGSVTTGTTAVPLITFRSKADFIDRARKVDSFDVLTSTAPHILELRLDGTLTGASYATPTNGTASELAHEVDTSATAITGGTVIYSQLVEGGGKGVSAFASQEGLQYDIPERQPITLCARTLSGTDSITSHFRMIEEW